MRPVIVILFLLITQFIFGNAVDSLKTDSDVLHFFQSLDKKFRDTIQRQAEIRPTDSLLKERNCDGMFEKWKTRNWEKADFNQDGNMDIVATIYWNPTGRSNFIHFVAEYEICVAIDNGNNTFKLVYLSHQLFSQCEVVKPGLINQQQFLLMYHKKSWPGKTNNFWDTQEVAQADTLIYKDSSFIEWNGQPSYYPVKTIFFETWGCYGTCPVFELSIDQYGHATYNAIRYNKQKGKFKMLMKKDDLNQIKELINYLGIKKLRDRYAVSWTDDAGCDLVVKFNDGSVKKIRDYGMIGSFGLTRLYDLFYKLADSQEWK